MTWILQRHNLPSLALASGALIMLALLTGCRDSNIQVYQVPKEVPPPTTARAPGAPAEVPHLHWKTPAGWEEGEASGIRLARFSVKGGTNQEADVSIVMLAGLEGRNADIVNLWRTELGLPAASADELAATTAAPVGDLKGDFYEMVSERKVIAGDDKGRILASIVNYAGATWCFKIAGNDELVRQQKPVFLEFLRSIEFDTSSHDTSSAPPLAAGNASRENAGSFPRPEWNLPPTWKEVPPTQMLLAKFVATEAEARAEITVSMFPGTAGGLLGNVNRWRDQLGLSPVSAAELEKLAAPVDLDARKIMLVDMTGTEKRTGQPSRIVGAVESRADGTWFFKMMGDKKVADREKQAFLEFVKTVRYPND